MKANKWLMMVVAGCLLGICLPGCAGVKEVGRGFIGISTRVLEEERPNALKKSFALGYDRCYAQVKEILSQEDNESYVYAQDPVKKLIAVYLSPTDTTPVGIFFTVEDNGNTLIEISSQSTYAKEEIAKRIFTGMGQEIKPKKQENKTDVKEKSAN